MKVNDRIAKSYNYSFILGFVDQQREGNSGSKRCQIPFYKSRRNPVHFLVQEPSQNDNSLGRERVPPHLTSCSLSGKGQMINY